MARGDRHVLADPPDFGTEHAKNGRSSAVVARSDLAAPDFSPRPGDDAIEPGLATPLAPDSQRAPATEWMETWTTT